MNDSDRTAGMNPLRNPRLRAAEELLRDGRFAMADRLLREFRSKHPRDPGALYLAGKAASALGRHGDAETLLAETVELAPDYIPARHAWAAELIATNRPKEAAAEADELLRRDPQNRLFRAIRATALDSLGDQAEAALLWRQLTRDYPSHAEYWERLGHSLRATGPFEECVAAYRTYIERAPSPAGGWWDLADLKTFRFDTADIEQMQAQLTRSDLSPQDRIFLNFALGRAYAQSGLFAKSFTSYATGNALQRVAFRYDPDVLTTYVQRCERLFTANFFGHRTNSGCTGTGPIFIVGMPRSGSTLVEQILASHPQIEGAGELRVLDVTTNAVTDGYYPFRLEKLDSVEFERLGEAYLEGARAHRRLGRPFFTDKMGANYAHLGLIHLSLPNAKVIDVRRHPLAFGVSNFVQMFSPGVRNASSLPDIGWHYRDYVRLMAHFDRVLPGKVHRVFYENIVERPEHEIRRMLDYLGLAFDESCLDFHKTDRVVGTVSAEQVRRPIYRDAIEQWRNYEPWLEPLKSALGSVLDKYPDVPIFE